MNHKNKVDTSKEVKEIVKIQSIIQKCIFFSDQKRNIKTCQHSNKNGKLRINRKPSKLLFTKLDKN